MPGKALWLGGLSTGQQTRFRRAKLIQVSVFLIDDV